MSKGEKSKDLIAQLWGWVLFVVCGLLFTIAALRANDILSMAASITFLLGCLVFIIPLVKAIRQDEQ